MTDQIEYSDLDNDLLPTDKDSYPSEYVLLEEKLRMDEIRYNILLGYL